MSADLSSKKQKTKSTTRYLENAIDSIRRVLFVLQFFFQDIKKYKPITFILYIIEIIIFTINPFLNIILPKLIIDELIGERSKATIMKYVIFLIVGNALIGIIKDCIKEIKELFVEDICYHEMRMIVETGIDLRYENMEDPKVLDAMALMKNGVMQRTRGGGAIFSKVTTFFRSLATLVGVVAIIVSGCPSVFVVIIISLIIVSIIKAWLNKCEIKFNASLSLIDRIFKYAYYEMADRKSAKDIRLYAAQEMMEKKESYYDDKIINNMRQKYLKIRVPSQVVVIINVLRDTLIYLFIAYLAIQGKIGIGDFSMYISATLTLSTCLNDIMQSVLEIFQQVDYVHDFVVFVSGKDHIKDGKLGFNATNYHEIEAKNVSFRYPRSDSYALKNLNLKIKSGEHLSIVGLNGSGKSTFIKLLCRLYDVTEGEILIDGVNINQYKLEDYLKLLTVVFQDFKVFAFSLKENIAFEKEISEDLLNDILEQANLAQDIRKFPGGFETPVSKDYEESGVELSGGQQQKLAIARSLFKNSPIVILDEPTAALDPLAEYEVYHKFNYLAESKTAIFISHRLSSCKFCDHIAVFDNGTIAEYGTHDELIKIEHGIYSNMFQVQAKYYVN